MSAGSKYGKGGDDNCYEDAVDAHGRLCDLCKRDLADARAKGIERALDMLTEAVNNIEMNLRARPR